MPTTIVARMIIDGKVFIYYITKKTKGEAQSLAKTLRRQDYRVRTKKVKGGYEIWKSVSMFV